MGLRLDNNGPSAGRFHLVVAGVLCVFWLSLIALVMVGRASMEDLKGLLGMLAGVAVGWAMPAPRLGARATDRQEFSSNYSRHGGPPNVNRD